MAASLASVPELQKKILSKPPWFIKNLASFILGSEEYKFEVCNNFLNCFSVSFSIAGWQWPKGVHPKLLKKSKYFLFLLSQTNFPFPFTSVIG